MANVIYRGPVEREPETINLPVAAALFVTMGALGWLGVPLTFFTLLCVFVLAGLALAALCQVFGWGGYLQGGTEHDY